VIGYFKSGITASLQQAAEIGELSLIMKPFEENWDRMASSPRMSVFNIAVSHIYNKIEFGNRGILYLQVNPIKVENKISCSHAEE